MAATTKEAEVAPNWLDAEKDYGLALLDGKLVCRNPKGKPLASVPKWLKDSDLAQQMVGLNEWLGEHDQQCRDTVDRWMLRSLPVPRAVLSSIWPDPSWQNLLMNTVACAVSKKGELDQDKSGFLRNVDAKKGVGIIDLDGETQWIKTESIALPHPILLAELDDYRELSTELGFQQSLDQLFRQTYQPTEEQMGKSSIEDFSGGKFNMLMHVLGLCRRLGYRVRGGNACCAVWESGTLVEARMWVGSESPEYETWTGELIFTDSEEKALVVKDVGPVAFSEGMRMASAIYAKRVVDEGNDE